MAVIVLVVFASTSIVVSVIRSNNENIDTLVAYGLAQEGLEGLRNIRDSNWLLDAKFNGKIRTVDVWGESFPDSTEAAYYTIDLATLERSTLGVDSPDALASTTPWKLSGISQEAAENLDDTTLILKLEDSITGEVRYGHSQSLGSGDETLFHRYVTIQNISDPAQPMDKIRVSSVVNWMELARKKEVRMDTVLTDWNQGQL